MNMIQAPGLPTTEQQVLPLRDIKLPAEPGFWPLAPGWWVVLLLAAVLCIWLGIKWYRHHQKKRRWQSINQQLAVIEHDYRQSKDAQHLLTQVATFLRRFVKYQLQHDQAVSYTGEAWINHLNDLDTQQSFSPYSQALTSGAYQANFDYDTDGLLTATRAFIKRQVFRPSKTNLNKTQPDEGQHV